MSCRHKRQSNEIDSENAATSAAGPPAKRPERETGLDFFEPAMRGEFAERRSKFKEESALVPARNRSRRGDEAEKRLEVPGHPPPYVGGYGGAEFFRALPALRWVCIFGPCLSGW